MQAESTKKNSRVGMIVADAIAYVVLTFSVGLAVSLAMAGAVLLLASEARAAQLAPLTQGEVRQGTLLFRTGEGDTVAAPLLHTDVRIRVSGLVARASVVQTFRNPSEEWFEGIYVFPLPEDAAVDRLRMRIGERVVEGEIRERQAAKREYDQAKRSGRRAALVEQERPNVFTTSVANIGPRQDVVVEIEYQQALHYAQGAVGGEYRLRFPMVVGPRYIPGSAQAGGEAEQGWAQNTDAVPDAARITPPVLHPDAGPFNPVSLRVELDAGVPLARLASSYHEVQVRELEGGRREIELADEAPADRDFELVWETRAGEAPQVGWFAEKRDGRTYGLLMVMPPAVFAPRRPLPREVVFVIDTSGSMHGASIAQAREALLLALDRLGPQDRFNVIEFNSKARALFAEAAPAGPAYLDAARRFVRGLKADGGTEMAQALGLALDGRDARDRVRQVVFLTDGAVGNEDELFRLIANRLGDSRLFTVGIGSAPNSHFMSKAARLGRGSFTYVGKVEEVKEKMLALFARLESPVLKDLQVSWPEGVQAETWPKRLPDLYAGEPVVLTVTLDRAAGEARVEGMQGTNSWQAAVPLAAAHDSPGVAALWARDKIGALIDSLREGAAEDKVRAEVVGLASSHHLVTRYTSLVAVDRTPVRPLDAALRSGALPTNLPQGWSYEKVFGELPQGATDARFKALIGALATLLALLMLALSRRPALRPTLG